VFVELVPELLQQGGEARPVVVVRPLPDDVETVEYPGGGARTALRCIVEHRQVTAQEQVHAAGYERLPAFRVGRDLREPGSRSTVATQHHTGGQVRVAFAQLVELVEVAGQRLVNGVRLAIHRLLGRHPPLVVRPRVGHPAGAVLGDLAQPVAEVVQLVRGAVVHQVGDGELTLARKV
jgi:hypothetical protein